MEMLILIGLVVIGIILYKLKIMEVAGEQLNTGMDERIKLNVLKAEQTIKTGGKESFHNVDSKVVENENVDILGLMESILLDLGCQPKKENEGELLVAYQGENFIVKTGGFYAQIWDPGWAHINVKDPNFEKMKTAANISNFNFGPSIIWTSPNEEGMVALHSKREILLHPNLPDKSDYIKAVLDSFFEKKENMRGQFHALIDQQQHSPKQHRPVGFATSEE